METLMESLNDVQKEAAVLIDKNVRIVAGAGSGKTRVLMARIEYLLNEVGIYPSRILAITFTNKAVSEMKERLQKQIGDQAGRVRISTIHSLCARILREDAHHLGYDKNFAILDTDDQKRLLLPYYKQHDIDKKKLPPAKVLSMISHYKTIGITPQDLETEAAGEMMPNVLCLYREYERRLDEMKAMDFDDLLLKTDHLLGTNEEVRNKWQSRLDYIHVDEFQDVDFVQYKIIQNLCRKDAILCVVGDPDQTIYTWRGASIDIILNFHKDFQPCKTIILDQNYRSTPNILNASNALVAHNKNRIQKNLYCAREENDPIIFSEQTSDEKEAIYVVEQIMKLHKKEKIPYGDFAILYRNNYSSLNFERVLKHAGIPYKVFGGFRFFERQEIKDILCYLQLMIRDIQSAEDKKSLDLYLERVINQPRRQIGTTTMDKIRMEAQNRNISYLEAVQDPQTLTASTAKKVKAFYKLIESLRQKLTLTPVSEIINMILEETGYKKMLQENREMERLDNLEQLQNDITRSALESSDFSLESYLQEVSLYTDKSDDNVMEGVNLMTVHAAKGTEYPVVFIVNVNEKIFPSARALSENRRNGLEEERRLMYVAMTRAKNKLYITWNRDYSPVWKEYKKASRFIGEIPAEYVEDEGKKKGLEEKNQKIARKSSLQEAQTLSGYSSSKKKKARNGDIVLHDSFGEGVIISVEDNFAKAAFPIPFNVKKINLDSDLVTLRPKKGVRS